MRGLRPVLASLFVLLAGCSGSPADAPDAADETAPEEGEIDVPMAQHFEQTYDLVALDVALQGQHMTASQESDNCVLLDDHATILAGTATVTWDATPATPAMDLILWADPAHKAYATGSGGQLVLDLAGVEVAADHATMLSWQVAADATLGAAVQMDGQMTLSFEYVLDAETNAMRPDAGWTCVAER